MFHLKYGYTILVFLLALIASSFTKTTSSSSYSYSSYSYTSYRSTSYRSTSYRSYSSGSSGSAKCSMSTTMWIVVPIVVIISFVIIFWIVTIIIVLCKRAANRRTNKANSYAEQRRICEEAKRKKEAEEATKLTKLHLEIEADSFNQMYATNQSSFTIAPTDTNKQNNFIVPGTSVQPSYVDVNPYSGHHNNNIVPVVYNPADYGVVYDKPLVFQQPVPTAPVVVQTAPAPMLVPQSNPIPVYYNYPTAPNSMIVPQQYTQPVPPQIYPKPI